MKKTILCVTTALFLAAAACSGGDTGSKGAGKAKVAKADKKKKDKKAKGDKAKGDKGKADKAKADDKAAPEMPKDAVFVVHTVKDFAKWKEVFDAHEAARAGAGIVWHVVLQEDGKPNNVLLGMITADVAKSKAFVGSEDLKKAMGDAGVEGKPDIAFFKVADANPPPEGTDAKNGLVVRHKVKDYAAWKKAFDAHADKRKDAGAVSHGVLQNADDPNDLLVHMEGTDAAKLKEFAGSEGLKKAMQEAGVEGKPTMWFVNHVEEKAYGKKGDGKGDVAKGGDAKGGDAKGGDAKADAAKGDAKGG